MKKAAPKRPTYTLPPRLCEVCGQSFVPHHPHCRMCEECADAVYGKKGAPILLLICKDCKKPTSNYRCEKCREKWEMRHGVPAGAHGDAYVCAMRGGLRV